MMRLRVPELLAERDWTAYRLAKASGGRISMSAAYRLAKTGKFGEVSPAVLDALCDVFGIKDPGPLFARRGRRRSGRQGSGR